MDKYQFIIAEFHDGLQIIPAVWYNTDKLSCIWPNHMKTKYRINKAIMAREMPRERSDWEELPIKRIFGGANTYEQSLEKLSVAQDTSNIDDTGMSSNSLTEQKKQQRRKKAKRQISPSSSSSSEDICLKNKENKLNIRQSKILPPFPDKGNFLSTDKDIEKPTQNITNILHEKNVINPMNSNDKDTNRQVTNYKKGLLTESSTVNINKDSADAEFKKQVLLKLNKIQYKLDTLENKVDILDNKIEFSNPVNKESNVAFPIPSIAELTYFEEQLQEIEFKNEVLNIFKLVGGNTAHIMIHNILKKAVTNSVAINFSWAGKRNKKSFKDLNLAKIIAQAVRILHGQVTDNDIADSISKWLAQATLRTQREKLDQTK